MSSLRRPKKELDDEEEQVFRGAGHRDSTNNWIVIGAQTSYYVWQCYPEVGGFMEKAAIVGVHHKTGTVLVLKILKLIIASAPPNWTTSDLLEYSIPNHMRKLPLSQVLKSAPKAWITSNIWFEHEIDMNDIRFLHFVRDPLKRIASGYLYHKRGAPSDVFKWVDWAIFEHNGKKSYKELLNELSLADGLLFEAIRTFPEALGTARAFKSSLRLPPEDRLTVWLDEFLNNPVESLNSISGFFFGAEEKSLNAFRRHAVSADIIMKDETASNKSGHVTKNHESRKNVEDVISNSAEIKDLYEPVLRHMNMSPAPLQLKTRGRTSDLINEIRLKTKYMVIHPQAIGMHPDFWNDKAARDIWQTFPLSNFALGHLMMYPFMQEFISGLN